MACKGKKNCNGQYSQVTKFGGGSQGGKKENKEYSQTTKFGGKK